MIIDYSTARPSIATLKAHGVTAAGRYIGWDSVPGFRSIGKNITRGEAGHLLAAGIAIFLAFEYAADAALKGRDQGLKDGHLASEQLAALGAPAGMTVYFALDFDIRDYAPAGGPVAKLGPAADYFNGIHATKPAYTVGVYGGYYAVSRCLDGGLAQMAWQTVAWSGTPTQWDPRAVIRQQLGTPLPGADLDTVRLNTASGHDYGQWPRPPKPKPAPQKWFTFVTEGRLSAHDLAHKHGITFEHMHAETVLHFHPLSANAPATYAFLNDCADPDSFVDLKNPAPAGVTWRLPVIPS